MQSGVRGQSVSASGESRQLARMLIGWANSIRKGKCEGKDNGGRVRGEIIAMGPRLIRIVGAGEDSGGCTASCSSVSSYLSWTGCSSRA